MLKELGFLAYSCSPHPNPSPKGRRANQSCIAPFSRWERGWGLGVRGMSLPTEHIQHSLRDDEATRDVDTRDEGSSRGQR